MMLQWLLRLVLVGAMATVGFVGARLAVARVGSVPRGGTQAAPTAATRGTEPAGGGTAAGTSAEMPEEMAAEMSAELSAEQSVARSVALSAALGVRTGQVVALLGAGDGALALHLARTVGPGGAVHVLDPGEGPLRSLQAAAARHGVGHVVTWRRGLDEPPPDFGGREVDALIVTDAVGALLAPAPLLQAWAPVLGPEAARVVFVQPRLDERFAAADVDAAFLQAWQRARGAEAPPGLRALRAVVEPRLPPAVRDRLAAGRWPLSAGERQQVAAAWTRLLPDRGLVPALDEALEARGSGVAQELTSLLSLPDARLLQWLVLHFDDQGLLEARGPALPALAQAALHTANAIVLSPLLGAARRARDATNGPWLSPVGLVRRLAAAGYRRVAATGTDHHLVLAFAPERERP